jgi:hypothetical protein
MPIQEFNLDLIPDIAPENFTYERYCGKVGVSIDDLFIFGKSFNFKKFIVEGKCPGSKLPIRPRLNKDTYGLMVISKETGEYVWCHVIKY